MKIEIKFLTTVFIFSLLVIGCAAVPQLVAQSLTEKNVFGNFAPLVSKTSGTTEKFAEDLFDGKVENVESLPIKINCGSKEEIADFVGENLFAVNTYPFAVNGKISTDEVTGAAPVSVYRTKSGGQPQPEYKFKLEPNTEYLVRLHLAEDRVGTLPGDYSQGVKINETVRRAAALYTTNTEAPNVVEFPNDEIDVMDAAGGLNKLLIVDYYARSDSAGNLDIKLFSNTSSWATQIFALEIHQAPPRPEFQVSGNGDQTVARTFTDISKPTATSRIWDFGDKNRAVTETATHKFKAGTYRVRLTTRTAEGLTRTSYQDITIPGATNLSLFAPNILSSATVGAAYSQNIFSILGSQIQVKSLKSFSDKTGQTRTPLTSPNSGSGTYWRHDRRDSLPAGLAINSSGIYGVPTGIEARSRVIVVGDSLMTGFLGGDEPDSQNYSIAAILRRKLSQSWDVFSLSAGGKTLHEIKEGLATDLIPLRDPTYEKDIVVLSAGINDIQGIRIPFVAGTGEDSTYKSLTNDLQYTVFALQNAGFRVVVGDVQTFDQMPDVYQQTRKNFNSWIMSSLAGADVKFDWTSEDHRLASSYNPIYFQYGGALHNTPYGYTLRANVIKNAIDLIKPNTNGARTAANYKFFVQVTDSDGNVGEQPYTLTVNPSNTASKSKPLRNSAQ